jgi:hypothetical protein
VHRSDSTQPARLPAASSPDRPVSFFCTPTSSPAAFSSLSAKAGAPPATMSIRRTEPLHSASARSPVGEPSSPSPARVSTWVLVRPTTHTSRTCNELCVDRVCVHPRQADGSDGPFACGKLQLQMVRCSSQLHSRSTAHQLGRAPHVPRSTAVARQQHRHCLRRLTLDGQANTQTHLSGPLRGVPLVQQFGLRASRNAHCCPTRRVPSSGVGDRVELDVGETLREAENDLVCVRRTALPEISPSDALMSVALTAPATADCGKRTAHFSNHTCGRAYLVDIHAHRTQRQARWTRWARRRLGCGQNWPEPRRLRLRLSDVGLPAQTRRAVDDVGQHDVAPGRKT